MYIDGGFRWDSTVHAIHPGVTRAVLAEERDEKCVGADRPVLGQIYKTGGDVTAPKAIRMPDPEYSELARKEKVSGSITLSVVADVDGCAKNIQVNKPIGYGLDEKAVEALKMWKFEPGTKNGTPVPVQLQVSMDFRLY
jgi:TonB family protein